MHSPSESPLGPRSRVSSFSGSERGLGPEAEAEALRQRVSRLEDEIVRLKKQSIAASQAAEAEEEGIVNRVLKRLNDLKKEKEDLIMSIEQEEEFLTNTLQRKLSVILAEKEALERRLSLERAGLAGLRGSVSVVDDAEAKGADDALAPPAARALELLLEATRLLDAASADAPPAPPAQLARAKLSELSALLEAQARQQAQQQSLER
mmetsp:Transcript_2105/g.6342  ORF Transcript_2105/g.6342 Transcript_2105/m.6342 type:complete len:207 (+) Transcript_2105:241-861(+)